MSLLDNLPHECTIQRRIRSNDGLSGNKRSVTVEQTAVSCWEQQASASEITAYGKRGITITTKVYFTSDPQVTERHQLLITSRNGTAVASPDVLDVQSQAIPDASAGLAVLFRVMCNRVSGENQ